MRETDAEFGEAHDRWLSNYHEGTEIVWCSNRECPNHLDGQEIGWVSENGQSWWEPEDCFLCHGGWLNENPRDE